MDLIVSTEARFLQTPDGTVWTRGGDTHSRWAGYLDVFEGVKVLARVRRVQAVDSTWSRADGDRVVFAPLPYYLGPLQYVLRAGAVRRAIRAAIAAGDAVIMRVGSPIANHVERICAAEGRPFGLLVVCDPHEVFAPGTIRHPLRPLLRWWFTRSLVRQCRTACAAAYVTEQALQRRYPSVAVSEAISDVEITEAWLSGPRTFAASTRRRVVFVGSLEQTYKGPDVLIRAVERCLCEGLDLRLTLVGGGRGQPALEALAAQLGIASRVTFTGEVTSGAAVRAHLDAADLFVLPSRTEGLPRALVEAMARALPCIGSAVGGIPELLPADDLVPAGDGAALAAKMREVLIDPQRLTAMSAQNRERAEAFREDRLRAARGVFLRRVRNATEVWNLRRPIPAAAPSGTAASDAAPVTLAVAERIRRSNLEVHQREAPMYDVLHSEIFGRPHQRRIARDLDVIATALHGRSARVMDIGCGTGNLTLKYLRRGYFVRAVDLSAEMTAVLRQKVRAADAGRIELVVSDAEAELDKPDGRGSWDLISFSSVLHHLPDYHRVLRAALGQLKPGGILYVCHEPLSAVAKSPGARGLVQRALKTLDGRYTGARVRMVHLREWLRTGRRVEPLDYRWSDYHVATGIDMDGLLRMFEAATARVIFAHTYQSYYSTTLAALGSVAGMPRADHFCFAVQAAAPGGAGIHAS